jgi:hypothetical protein
MKRKEGPLMFLKIMWSVLLAVVAALVIRSLPDIARYLKIREM